MEDKISIFVDLLIAVLREKLSRLNPLSFHSLSEEKYPKIISPGLYLTAKPISGTIHIGKYFAYFLTKPSAENGVQDVPSILYLTGDGTELDSNICKSVFIHKSHERSQTFLSIDEKSVIWEDLGDLTPWIDALTRALEDELMDQSRMRSRKSMLEVFTKELSEREKISPNSGLVELTDFFVNMMTVNFRQARVTLKKDEAIELLSLVMKNTEG